VHVAMLDKKSKGAEARRKRLKPLPLSSCHSFWLFLGVLTIYQAIPIRRAILMWKPAVFCLGFVLIKFGIHKQAGFVLS